MWIIPQLKQTNRKSIVSQELQKTALKSNRKMPRKQHSTRKCGLWNKWTMFKFYPSNDQYSTIMQSPVVHREENELWLEELKEISRRTWYLRWTLITMNSPGGEGWGEDSFLKECQEQRHPCSKACGGLAGCQVPLVCLWWSAHW